MIKKNDEVREFIMNEVANQFIGYVIEMEHLEPIAEEVQESAESKFSLDVDGEAVLNIVRLFYLVQPFSEEIEWNRHPFDQIEKCFHEHFPSTEPRQVKQLCSDPIIAKKVRRFLFDNSISWIKSICKSLQNGDDNDIRTSGWMLGEMSKQIECINKVFISPSEPTSKAA